MLAPDVKFGPPTSVYEVTPVFVVVEVTDTKLCVSGQSPDITGLYMLVWPRSDR